MIQLQHISKVYEGTTRVEALKDINLEVKEGEIFGIIGQSGADKSKRPSEFFFRRPFSIQSVISLCLSMRRSRQRPFVPAG